MWIFTSPKNYSEMIEKISKSVFIISLLALYLISCLDEEFRCFLEKVSFGATYEIFGLKLNLALLYLPIAMGVLEHIFKVHDVLSKLLKIRSTYDKYIVKWFFEEINHDVEIQKIKKMKVNKLMSNIFYNYVSSTEPKIDRHSIDLALNEWCWFWIFLDTGLLLTITGVLFLICNFSWLNFGVLFLCGLVFIAIMCLILKQTINYTKKEIKAILSIVDYKKDIKKELENALHVK